MTFKRSLRRWLLDCATVAPVVTALALPPASALAKPDEKPVKSAAETAKPGKPKSDKTKAAKTKPAKNAGAAKKPQGVTEEAWAKTQPWAKSMAECPQDADRHADGEVRSHTRMVVAEVERRYRSGPPSTAIPN